MGKDYVDQFRAIYADLARRYDLIFYPFFLEGAALNDDLMQADGIHPNAKGVAVIVENIMPKVDELLAKVAGEALAIAGPRGGESITTAVGRAGGAIGLGHHLRSEAAISGAAPADRRGAGEAGHHRQ